MSRPRPARARALADPAARLLVLCLAAAGCAPRPLYEGGSLRRQDLEDWTGRRVFVHCADGERISGSLSGLRASTESAFVVVVPDPEDIGKPETLAIPLADVERLAPDRRRSGSWFGMALFVTFTGALFLFFLGLSAATAGLS
jgi:hypothetical protein